MSDPRIADLDITHVTLPYRLARKSSWNVRRGTDTLVVRLTDDTGAVGYGDCVFNQSVTAGMQLLEMTREMIVGTSIYEVERLNNALSVAGWWNHKLDRSFVGAALIAALDMALWDLVGKHAGLPLHKLLGGPVATRLDLSYTVPSGPPAEMEREVAFALEKGFTTLYVKLAKTNASLDDDVDTVARLRRLAPRARLIADVNGAWTLVTAVRALRKMETHDLAFVETPVFGLENMAKLRQRVGVPIAADEEACSLRKLMQVVRMEAADVVMLDLTALGGVRGLQKAADVLEAANIPAVVHGNGEMLAPFAAFQVAMSHPSFAHFAHQFYFEHGETYVAGHPVLAACRPVLVPGSRPGLGVAIDEARLTAMAARSPTSHHRDTELMSPQPAAVPRFPKY